VKSRWRQLPRSLRWSILTFAALTALFVLVLLVEHFRGRRALAQWRAAMLAQGEQLTVDELRPPVTPFEDNGPTDLIWPSLATPEEIAAYEKDQKR
jgi:hypothetical protein